MKTPHIQRKTACDCLQDFGVPKGPMLSVLPAHALAQDPCFEPLNKRAHGPKPAPARLGKERPLTCDVGHSLIKSN